MINRVCSYCGSNTGYDNNYKESNGYWYSSVTRDNKKRCLYFLCSNCYAKQADKNSEWSPFWQNRKGLDIKQKVSTMIRSKLKISFIQKIIVKAIE
jgi:hypothetical protein